MHLYSSLFLPAVLAGVTASAPAQWRTIATIVEPGGFGAVKQHSLDLYEAGVRVLFETEVTTVLPIFTIFVFDFDFDVPVGWNGQSAPSQVRIRVSPPCGGPTTHTYSNWRNFTAHALCSKSFPPKLGSAWEGTCALGTLTGKTEFVASVAQPSAQDATARAIAAGVGCGGSGRLPTLVSDAPRVSLAPVGTIAGTQAAPITGGVLLFSSLSGASVDIGSGCRVYLAPPSLGVAGVFVTDASGGWSMVQPGLPPGLECSTLLLQAAMLPTNGPVGIDLTRPLFWYVGH